MSDKRREPRYAARIVARVVRRGETLELLTNDVSFRGAFLRTDAPPALRQLVKVEFALPTGETVAAHAMVVHVEGRGPDGQRVPGVGLQFWGPIQESKAWSQFVYDLKVKERAGVAAARATDKVRRASERFKLALDVVLDGKRLVARDVSLTGISVRSEVPMPIGARVAMQLQASGKEPITIDVVVRRHIKEPGFKGLGLEFVDATDEARRRLMEFVRANAPEDDAIYIDVDDPGLH